MINTTSQSLNAFLDTTTTDDGILVTDGNNAYGSKRRRVSVNHSVGEYVRGLSAHEWNRKLLGYAQAWLL
ncbi:MAG: hypothetical protein OXI96_03665 [Acidimicrobiaceae bacterium]|nr:hypothetical protein [Acidimicrobiaceae bacterium]